MIIPGSHHKRISRSYRTGSSNMRRGGNPESLGRGEEGEGKGVIYKKGRARRRVWDIVERETEGETESIWDFKRETKGREEDKEDRREVDRVAGTRGGGI
jgi:hypothetical protein